jgi:hypothetical protein
MPLSTALIFQIRGTVATVDEAGAFFALSVGKNGLVSVGYEGAFFNFSNSFETDGLGELIAPAQSLDEVVSIGRPDGLVLTLYTLKE